MSCALTSGFTLDCRDSVGGIQALYINTTANVTAYTAASGTVTALTKSSVFYKYELEEENSMAQSVLTGSRPNGTVFFAQQVSAIFQKLTYQTRDNIVALGKNRLVVIVKDNNGKYWICGKDRGLMITTSTAVTGTAMGDLNGYTVVFDGNEPNDWFEYTGTEASLIT
jgi:hypothetical protein